MNLLVTNVTLNGAWEVKPAVRGDCAGWGGREEMDDTITVNVECYDDRQKGRD